MDFILTLTDEQIGTLSKTLAHYVFRNGVVDDIHADGKLSQDDMKRLNKDVRNRIAGLFTALRDGRGNDVEQVLAFHSLYGSNWDSCVPYMDEFDSVAEGEKRLN